MIIKSMSRKNKTFSQLYDYMENWSIWKRFELLHNFQTSKIGRKEILWEFLKNSELLPNRKNGNYMYHEVISITKGKNMTELQQKHILKDLAEKYIEKRADSQIVFWLIHEWKNDFHYHLMISSNDYWKPKRKRIEKKKFYEYKIELEKYILEKYPKFEQKVLYQVETANKKKKEKELKQEKTRDNIKEKTNEKTYSVPVDNREYEYSKRTQKQTKREMVKEIIEGIYNESHTREEYKKNLREQWMEAYKRGKHHGIIYEWKRYRLAKLWLEKQHGKLENKILEQEKRQKELDHIHKEKNKNKDKKKDMDSPSLGGL